MFLIENSYAVLSCLDLRILVPFVSSALLTLLNYRVFGGFSSGIVVVGDLCYV